MEMFYNPYRIFETPKLQEEIVELECHTRDCADRPEIREIAEEHLNLARLAITERF